MRGEDVLSMKVGSMTVHEKIYWCSNSHYGHTHLYNDSL